MPNRPAVMHPRLLGSLTEHFYALTVTVERATVVQDPVSGEETATWAAVGGLTAIPATIAPLNIQGISSGETRGDKGTWAVNAWQVDFPAYYPSIRQTDRILLDDGRYYNILGVEHDSHRQQTRLECEEVV